MKTIKELKEENYGFLTSETIKDLVEADPYYMVLIRCGSSRLTCMARDVEHVVKTIDASSKDYVRDVSFLAS
jgi:hypothetical protein